MLRTEIEEQTNAADFIRNLEMELKELKKKLK